MPIVISRSGDTSQKQQTITQEQRDELWAAVVRNWIDKHQDEFAVLLAEPERASA